MNMHGKNQRNTLRAYHYAQKAGQNQRKEKPMNLKKYKSVICIIAAVCLLGAAAFCGFRTYANSYGTISERIIQPLKVLYKSQSNF